MTPIPIATLPEKLPVVDSLGNFMFWADEEKARSLIHERKVTLLRGRSGGEIRKLQVIPGEEEAVSAADFRYMGTRYSHSRETEENPKNCWTLKKLPRGTREIFTTVLDECMTA
jgi:hypothetical protein